MNGAMTQYFPSSTGSAVAWVISIPVAAVKATPFMMTPITSVVGVAFVTLMAEAENSWQVFGHPFDFWLTATLAVVALIGLGTQKYRSQREADSEKALALATQRADQAEKMLAATKKELDEYRLETHARLEDTHAKMIAFTLENEKLREKTDMTPILNFMQTLVSQMDKHTGVISQLVNKFPGLRDPATREREVDQLAV